MLLPKLFLCAVLLFNYSCSAQDTKKTDAKINGLSFVASNKKLLKKDILPVVKFHANWVALMPFGYMPSDKEPMLTFNTEWQWWGETHEGIKATSSLFYMQGIKRMLKPQIWIKGGRFTGLIAMKSEEEWLQFEKKYETFILYYAKLAQEEHIELLCIGTELNLFVKSRPDYWKLIILKIRKMYSGKLTYAANWDSYENPAFWDELDYIGIDAYFPLSAATTPTVKELNEAWTPTKIALNKFSQKKQKSIIFTEYGYRSIDFCAEKPWVSDTKANYNVAAQQNALISIFDTFWQETWFTGGFLWKWFDSNPNAGGQNHTGFTVQNKKTETTVKKMYKNQSKIDEKR